MNREPPTTSQLYTHRIEVTIIRLKMQGHLWQTVFWSLKIEKLQFSQRTYSTGWIKLLGQWNLPFLYWKFLYTFWGLTNKYIICQHANSKSIWLKLNNFLRYLYSFTAAVVHVLRKYSTINLYTFIFPISKYEWCRNLYLRVTGIGRHPTSGLEGTNGEKLELLDIFTTRYVTFILIF